MMLIIEHETKFTYSEPVHETVMEIRMSPASSEDQTLMGYRFRTTPAAPTTAYRDGFGNRVDLFNVLRLRRGRSRAGGELRSRPPPAGAGPAGSCAVPRRGAGRTWRRSNILRPGRRANRARP